MNWGELKVEVQDFIHRGDLSSKMDIFCTLAEAGINKDLRAMEMEKRDDITFVSAFTDLPTDYLEMRALHVEASGARRVLEEMTPQQLDGRYTSTSGTPRAFTIQAGQLELRPAPAGSPDSVDGEITYFARLTTLASGADGVTNDILDNYPLIYLSAMLIQANSYVQDDNETKKWMTFYDGQIQQANKVASEGRYNLPSVRI